MSYCPECGEEVDESQEFCDGCGANLSGSSSSILAGLPSVSKTHMGIGLIVLIAGVFAIPVQDTREITYTSKEPYNATETYNEQEPIMRQSTETVDFYTDRVQNGESRDFYNEDHVVAGVTPSFESDQISDGEIGKLVATVSTDTLSANNQPTVELRRAEPKGNFNSCYDSPEENSQAEILASVQSKSVVLEEDNLNSDEKYCIVVKPSTENPNMESEINLKWLTEETVRDTEVIEKERTVTQYRNVTRTKDQSEKVSLAIYVYRNFL